MITSHDHKDVTSRLSFLNADQLKQMWLHVCCTSSRPTWRTRSSWCDEREEMKSCMLVQLFSEDKRACPQLESTLPQGFPPDVPMVLGALSRQSTSARKVANKGSNFALWLSWVDKLVPLLNSCLNLVSFDRNNWCVDKDTKVRYLSSSRKVG